MAAPQQGNQGDNSTNILWGVAAVFAVLGAIWYTFKNHLIVIYLTIKLYEVNFLSLFAPLHFASLEASLRSALSHVTVLKFLDVVAIGQSAGSFLRYPFAALLIVLAFVVYFSNATRVFKHIYNMKQLAKLEKTNWPQISPVTDLDLIKTDIDKGPWAMALTPMQFCKQHRLLEETRPQRHEGMSRKEWDRVEVVLRRGEATKIFALQLGSLWKGIEYLPPYVKALFGAFAARLNADSKPAAELLFRLGRSSTSKLDMTGVDELLKKHAQSKLAQQIVSTHAYVSTVMAAMLVGAREDGVQASADFLWLKPLDRRLWYTLNTVGRQTPFVEVAGIFAHWVAEKEAGRKLIVPMVEEATKALELALKDIVYRKDEEENPA